MKTLPDSSVIYIRHARHDIQAGRDWAGLFTGPDPVSLAMSSACLFEVIGGLDPTHRKACFSSLSPDLLGRQAFSAGDVIAFVAILVFFIGRHSVCLPETLWLAHPYP